MIPNKHVNRLPPFCVTALLSLRRRRRSIFVLLVILILYNTYMIPPLLVWQPSNVCAETRVPFRTTKKIIPGNNTSQMKILWWPENTYNDQICPSAKIRGCKASWRNAIQKATQFQFLSSAPTVTIPNKVIFMTWWQGFELAPPLVRMCVESWKINNPTWKLVLITRENMKDYVNDQDLLPNWQEKKHTMRFSHQADLLRLALLAKYGGVWADATTLCSVPLDSWLSFVIGDDLRFFAFRNMNYKPTMRKQTYPISSWFLYGEPNSLVIQKLKLQVEQYWLTRETADEYFWFHYSLFHVFRQDQLLANQWMNVNTLERLSPHDLQSLSIRKPIQRTCTGTLGLSPVHKLTYKGKKSQKLQTLLQSMDDAGCRHFCQIYNCQNVTSTTSLNSLLEDWCDE